MARDSATRKWQITFNNPLDHGFSHDAIKTELIQLKSIEYWCMADEIGLETGTPHTHLFFYAKNAVMFSTLKNRFPPERGCHYEMVKGTCQQNLEYITKTGKWLSSPKNDTCVAGTFEEWGEMPIEHQGRSNFLDDLCALIKQGYSNHDIIEMNPNYALHIEKIDQLRQMYLSEKFKNEWRDVKTTYIYGGTGLGKTRSVMEHYGYENVYRVTDYQHPFDGYKGQDVIIFEEFRSSLKINDMLNYLDGYPLELPCRYNNKQACYHTVYIISNIPLIEQFRPSHDRDPETYNAFLRRIREVLLFTAHGIEKSVIEIGSNGFRTLLQGEYNAFSETVAKDSR